MTSGRRGSRCLPGRIRTARTMWSRPFWAEAPMLDGELVQGARPLLPLLASSGARIEGLRLGSGGLVLKVQRGDKAAQVRIGAGGPFPADAGLVVRLDYALPLPVLIERVRDLWNVTHGPVPRRGGSGGRTSGTAESARRSPNGEVGARGGRGAVRAHAVAADWHPDGDLRAKTRRRISKAVAMMEYGYRDWRRGGRCASTASDPPQTAALPSQA